MRHVYPRSRRIAAILTDAMLVAASIALLVGRPGGTLAIALTIAIPLVVVWGVLTLHYPRAVEIDDEGVAFSGYGRTHRYDFRSIRALRVRRFLVSDRVLVRILPAPPWRGRYWILDSIEGFPALLSAIEARARTLDQTERRSAPSVD